MMTQVVRGAIVPFEKPMEAAPALKDPEFHGATNVGVPQPVVEVVVLAVVMAPGVVGKMSMKFTPVSVE